MYNFNNRLNKLISLDIIRFCKIFEMFEYSFIFLILLCFTVYLLNQYYYKDTKENKKIEKSIYDEKNRGIFREFVSVFIDTILIIIIIFYVRKLALLFPSIPSILYPKFIPLTTINYTIHISLIVVFIGLMPSYNKKLNRLYEALKNQIF